MPNRLLGSAHLLLLFPRVHLFTKLASFKDFHSYCSIETERIRTTDTAGIVSVSSSLPSPADEWPNDDHFLEPALNSKGDRRLLDIDTSNNTYLLKTETGQLLGSRNQMMSAGTTLGTLPAGPSTTPTPPPDQPPIAAATFPSLSRKHALDEEDLDSPTAIMRAPPLPARPTASSNNPTPTASSILPTAPASPTSLRATRSNSSDSSVLSLYDPTEALARLASSKNTNNTSSTAVGTDHWNLRRAQWTSPPVEPTPSESTSSASSSSSSSVSTVSSGGQFPRHPALEEVTPDHFDAIYASLVTAQRKFSR